MQARLQDLVVRYYQRGSDVAQLEAELDQCRRDCQLGLQRAVDWNLVIKRVSALDSTLALSVLHAGALRGR